MLGIKIIYFRTNGADYAPTQCTIPEGNYNTNTFAAAICTTMTNHYPSAAPAETNPTRFVPNANLSNNTIVSLQNPTDTFELLLICKLLRYCLWDYTPIKFQHAQSMLFCETQLWILFKRMVHDKSC